MPLANKRPIYKKNQHDPAQNMPASAKAPELCPTPLEPDGIRIGGTAGEIDVNFCPNTMCGNFGLSWRQAEERGRPYRLRKMRKRGILSSLCTECGSNRKVYSNRAVDCVFLHTLKNTLPHEYCETEGCENRRVNFYENFPTLYTCRAHNPANSDYRARCSKCKKSFQVGVPWRRHGDQGRGGFRAAASEIRYPSDISAFMKLVCIGCGPSQVIEFLNCREVHYYALLHNLAAVCNSISGYFLMKLQRGRYSGRNGHFRLYSDIMTLSFRVSGKEIRYGFLKYLVTVTDYCGSYFVLAATPMFFPDDSKGTLREKLHKKGRKEAGLLECDRKYAHLLWAGADSEANRTRRSKRDGRTAFPILGLGGYVLVSNYGALGHFLLLRKMLSGIERVTHYVDNEPVLRMASVTAFADRIRERRCDVVSVSMAKKLSKKEAQQLQAQDRGKLKKRHDGPGVFKKLRQQALTERVAGIKGAIREEADAYAKRRPSLPARQRFPNGSAHVFGKAIGAAVPGYAGKPFGAPRRRRNISPQLWVRDPLSPIHEPDRHFLWLTRRQGRVARKREANLYLAGKLQPADTFFSSLRQVASTAQRPPSIAGRRHIRGYGSLVQLPASIISELALLRFYWNFMRKRRSSAKSKHRHISRAGNLDICQSSALEVEEAPTFREGVFERAEEITQWLGR